MLLLCILSDWIACTHLLSYFAIRFGHVYMPCAYMCWVISTHECLHFRLQATFKVAELKLASALSIAKSECRVPLFSVLMYFFADLTRHRLCALSP